MRVSAWVLAILFSGAVARHAVAAPAPGSASFGDLSATFEAVAARVTPSVVQVRVSSIGPLGEGEGYLGLQRQGGSGVIVSPDGDIVTNAHVVAGARRIEVVLAVPAAGSGPGRSLVRPPGKLVPAHLVGVDVETDLAVLRIEERNLPHLEFGDSDGLKAGQIVLAVGSPLGLQNSITMGIVSATGRQLRPEDRMVYVQTDAAINPGNSGGALVDARGKLVGVNTSIFSQSGGNEGIGFAAPSNIVVAVYQQLKTLGFVHRGDIGVVAQTITPTLAGGLGLDRIWGVILSDVRPGGPAAGAGLQPGDVVLEMDGKPMENGRQFDVNLYRRPVGSRVNLHVSRHGAVRTVAVEVGERDDEVGRMAARVSREGNQVPRLGILGITVDEQLSPMLPWLRAAQGVAVAGLTLPPPAAEEGGLQPVDVILAANGRSVATLDELRALVSGLPAGSSLALHVNRRGRLIYVALEIE